VKKSLHRTMFGRIGNKLRRQETKAKEVSGLTGRLALQHFVNEHVAHLVTIDYSKSVPVRANASTLSRKTTWGMVYDARVEWLIPCEAFEEHCRKRLKVDADRVLESALRQGAIIPDGKGLPTQIRPNPGLTGVAGEYIVFVVAIPDEKEL